MSEEIKETLKESLLKNAPNSSWRAMNFAIYVFSLCMLFLVTCVFILVLKTSIVTINLSTAKTEYFKDKTKIGRVGRLLDKMETLLNTPKVTAESPTSTTTYKAESAPDAEDSDSVALFVPTRPVPTATPKYTTAEEHAKPPSSKDEENCSRPSDPDIESLKQAIQELKKDEITPSDAFQALD